MMISWHNGSWQPDWQAARKVHTRDRGSSKGIAASERTEIVLIRIPRPTVPAAEVSLAVGLAGCWLLAA